MNVCLAMMAKGDPALVQRAVASALPYVSSVCLVVAPGDPLASISLPIATNVVLEPWQHHGHNRTVTIRHAMRQAPWVLMLDTDDVLAPGGALPSLADTFDAYEIPVYFARRWRFFKPQLFRSGAPIRYAGTTHEALSADVVIARWSGLVYMQDAASERQNKYHEDASKLAVELARNPNNPRAAFYYAQSLKDAGHTPEAYVVFRSRARLKGGFDEETLWALLYSAMLAVRAGASPEVAVAHYLEANAFAPDRAEPLAGLALHYRNRGEHDLALHYDLLAAAKPYPTAARSLVDLDAYSPAALERAGITRPKLAA